MSKRNEDEQFSDKEAAKRRDEVVKRMLNTPPQPRKPKRGSDAKPKRRGRKPAKD